MGVVFSLVGSLLFLVLMSLKRRLIFCCRDIQFYVSNAVIRDHSAHSWLRRQSLVPIYIRILCTRCIYHIGISVSI